MLAEARETWLGLNRPLDAAGCDLLKGMLLRDANPTAAEEALESAIVALESLDVPHMSERARAKKAERETA
jgi:hypothetical protein